jgi:hypothetical protein
MRVAVAMPTAQPPRTSRNPDANLGRLVVHALLPARRHRDEQLLDPAIVSVVGSFLSSSTAVACWVTDGETTLRFGMGVSMKGAA